MKAQDNWLFNGKQIPFLNVLLIQKHTEYSSTTQGNRLLHFREVSSESEKAQIIQLTKLNTYGRGGQRGHLQLPGAITL